MHVFGEKCNSIVLREIHSVLQAKIKNIITYISLIKIKARRTWNFSPATALIPYIYLSIWKPIRYHKVLKYLPSNYKTKSNQMHIYV